MNIQGFISKVALHGLSGASVAAAVGLVSGADNATIGGIMAGVGAATAVYFNRSDFAKIAKYLAGDKDAIKDPVTDPEKVAGR